MSTLKQSISILLFASLVTLLSCDKDCPEQDVDSLNAIYLSFKSGGSDGFSDAELESMMMIRFQLEELDSFNFPVDTFNYGEAGYYEDNNKIRLSRYLPQFETAGPPFYTSYKYIFTNADSAFTVTLQEIELEGSYDNDNCEYTNNKKTFRLNGSVIDATGSTDYVTVTKP